MVVAIVTHLRKRLLRVTLLILLLCSVKVKLVKIDFYHFFIL